MTFAVMPVITASLKPLSRRQYSTNYGAHFLSLGDENAFNDWRSGVVYISNKTAKLPSRDAQRCRAVSTIGVIW